MRFLLLALSLAALAPHAAAQTAEGRQARQAGQVVRALTALAVEDDSAAVRALNEVLATAPADPTLLALRAEASTRLGDPATAVYYARQATDAAPDRPDVLLGLATALRAAGQRREAADALARARRAAPTDLDVLVATASLAAETGDSATETDALRTLVRLGDTVAARLRLSALAERAGDRVEALAQARAAARLAPAEPAVRQRLATFDAHTPAASAPDVMSDDPDDLDALLAAVDADPTRIEVWERALGALAATADPRAGATADDALLLFPTVPGILAAAAEAYAAAGREADARDAAQRGIASLDRLGDAVEDADALRQRLGAVLSR